MVARRKPAKKVLAFTGDLTVSRAADLKEELLQAFTASDHIEVNLDKVTRMDLACLQLICSAHKTAIKDEKDWTIKSPDNAVFIGAGRESGFGYYAKCPYYPSHDCYWKGGIDNG